MSNFLNFSGRELELAIEEVRVVRVFWDRLIVELGLALGGCARVVGSFVDLLMGLLVWLVLLGLVGGSVVLSLRVGWLVFLGVGLFFGIILLMIR